MHKESGRRHGEKPALRLLRVHLVYLSINGWLAAVILGIMTIVAVTLLAPSHEPLDRLIVILTSIR